MPQSLPGSLHCYVEGWLWGIWGEAVRVGCNQRLDNENWGYRGFIPVLMTTLGYKCGNSWGKTGDNSTEEEVIKEERSQGTKITCSHSLRSRTKSTAVLRRKKEMLWSESSGKNRQQLLNAYSELDTNLYKYWLF